MAKSIVARAGDARRQAAYRARQRAKLAALKAALEKASATAGAGKSEAEVLAALARIERTLSQQSARLTVATRVEHGERILRRLTALERLVRGDEAGLAVMPKATRRRPLGVS